jgi:hypothetical protein
MAVGELDAELDVELEGEVDAEVEEELLHPAAARLVHAMASRAATGALFLVKTVIIHRTYTGSCVPQVIETLLK